MTFFTNMNEIWYACFDNTIASGIISFLADLNENIQCSYTCYENVQKHKFCFKVNETLFIIIVFSHKSCTWIKCNEACYC